jgi:hypothetical protein
MRYFRQTGRNNTLISERFAQLAVITEKLNVVVYYNINDCCSIFVRQAAVSASGNSEQYS